MGLLILALRDMAVGCISLGNGYANGKGIINVSEITVLDCVSGSLANINYISGRVNDESGIIDNAFTSLKGDNVVNE